MKKLIAVTGLAMLVVACNQSEPAPEPDRAACRRSRPVTFGSAFFA